MGWGSMLLWDVSVGYYGMVVRVKGDGEWGEEGGSHAL